MYICVVSLLNECACAPKVKSQSGFKKVTLSWDFCNFTWNSRYSRSSPCLWQFSKYSKNNIAQVISWVQISLYILRSKFIIKSIEFCIFPWCVGVPSTVKGLVFRATKARGISSLKQLPILNSGDAPAQVVFKTLQELQMLSRSLSVY